MEITIREAIRADCDVITALLEECDLGSTGVLTVGSSYWVAEDSGQIIGVIGLEYGQSAVLLRSAGVKPSHRRRGIGTQLFQHAAAMAEAARITTIYLFSTDAGTYWISRGFWEVPVPELVAALPDVFQVRHYDELGWLPTEVAWRHDVRERETVYEQ
jgi:N-acetylglutamate synthase-like GNAT family acetyltransferase